jgi:hypothetical protein
MDIELDTLDLESLRVDNDRLDTNKSNNNNASSGKNFMSNFIVLPEGNCNFNIRLMPPRKGKKPYQPTRLHKINNRYLHCRRELVNGKWVGDCPVCSYYTKLWKIIEVLLKEGKEAEAEALKAEARGLKPIERYYYNAIVRREVNADGEVQTNVGPKIYSCGKMIQRTILTNILGDPEAGEPGLGDVMNIKTGRDLKIVKKVVGSGKDAFPRYEGTKFVEPSPLGEEADVVKWINNMFDLAELREVKSIEELEKEIAIHRGLIPDDRNDNSGFDLDNFDKKYRKGGTTTQTMENVVSAVEPVATATENVAADVELSVDDEAFISELQDLQENA